MENMHARDVEKSDYESQRLTKRLNQDREEASHGFVMTANSAGDNFFARQQNEAERLRMKVRATGIRTCIANPWALTLVDCPWQHNRSEEGELMKTFNMRKADTKYDNTVADPVKDAKDRKAIWGARLPKKVSAPAVEETSKRKGGKATDAAAKKQKANEDSSSDTDDEDAAGPSGVDLLGAYGGGSSDSSSED